MKRKILLVLGVFFLAIGVASAQPPGSVDFAVDGGFDALAPGSPFPAGPAVPGGGWVNSSLGAGTSTYGPSEAQLNTNGAGNGSITQISAATGAGLAEVQFIITSPVFGVTLDVLVNGIVQGTFLNVLGPQTTGPFALLAGNQSLEFRTTGVAGIFEFDSVQFFAQPAPPPPGGGGGVPEINAAASSLPIAIVCCLGFLLSDGRRRAKIDAVAG